MSKYRKSPRASRTLIRRVLDARTGNAAAEHKLAAHLRQNPEDWTTARELDDLWTDVGRVPAPKLRLAPAAAGSSQVKRLLGPIHWSIPVALAAGGIGLIALAPFAIHRPAPTPQTQHFVADDGARTVRLADGSAVTLAPRSALDVVLSDARRDLTLNKGEAFFQVAHDTARPFVVAAAHGESRAVGTAFNVQLDGNAATVTVAEGTIQIAGTHAGAARTATAGQQIRYAIDPTGSATVIGPAVQTQDRNALGWRTGMLTFEGATLSQVVMQVNRYAPRPITIADPALARLPIFATVKVDRPDGLFAIVAAQAKLTPAQRRRALRVEGDG